MRSIRRYLAVLTAVLALGGTSLAATGCGSGGHLVGGIVAHHAINHFARTPRARRNVNRVFCLYHGHRVLVDLRTHHVFTAGLNAIQAYQSCKHGFTRAR